MSLKPRAALFSVYESPPKPASSSSTTNTSTSHKPRSASARPSSKENAPSRQTLGPKAASSSAIPTRSSTATKKVSSAARRLDVFIEEDAAAAPKPPRPATRRQALADAAAFPPKRAQSEPLGKVGKGKKAADGADGADIEERRMRRRAELMRRESVLGDVTGAYVLKGNAKDQGKTTFEYDTSLTPSSNVPRLLPAAPITNGGTRTPFKKPASPAAVGVRHSPRLAARGASHTQRESPRAEPYWLRSSPRRLGSSPIKLD